MQMEYTALENSFPRKTVLFYFDFSDVPLTDVCLYGRQGILVSVTIFNWAEDKILWQKCQLTIEIDFLLPVN